ncbi:hypothetical protein Tco_0453853 [Tanacetum coccineum]
MYNPHSRSYNSTTLQLHNPISYKPTICNPLSKVKKIYCLRGFRHTNYHGLAALTGIHTDLCVGFEVTLLLQVDKLALVWGKPRQPPLGPEEVRLAFANCKAFNVELWGGIIRMFADTIKGSKL